MSSQGSYSPLDRMLHRIAFCHPMMQRVLSELESDLYAKHLGAVDPDRAVFVTGLPRSGTTLILRMLHDTGEFAALTYRCMPFVLAPLLWRNVSRPFAKAGLDRERDHGDGIEIGPESPEAFEEVLWLNELKDKIIGDSCVSILAQSDIPDDFIDSFRKFMKKVIYLNAGPDNHSEIRYLSKNNANISRLGALATSFPQATILVLFREPIAQATSLLRQHRNFQSRHERDRFARDYMRWIGHYDFGSNFKPIRFDLAAGRETEQDYNEIHFWLKYWTQAYQFCLEQKKCNVHFIDYDGLLTASSVTLESIAAVVGLDNRERLVNQAKVVRAPTPNADGIPTLNTELADKIREVYGSLRAASLRCG